MKMLLIFRHAKSSWDDPGLDDHERPLNKRGRQDAPRMGQLIREEELQPDLILCSTAKRARSTAELAAKEAGYQGEIRPLDELYAAPAEAYLRVLAGISEKFDCVMLVGHNPGLENLLTLLSGRVEPLPTAALAHVRLDVRSWSDITLRTSGELIQVWRPKDL
ncbi:MAG: histidine phosphatase family protein [Anaerolineales bacterium]|nr:histidine phosphatase family protein [Anaerolineales bacterium]